MDALAVITLLALFIWTAALIVQWRQTKHEAMRLVHSEVLVDPVQDALRFVYANATSYLANPPAHALILIERVLNLYDLIGARVIHHTLPKAAFLRTDAMVMLRLWNRLGRFVIKERERRGDPAYKSSFEELVKLAEAHAKTRSDTIALYPRLIRHGHRASGPFWDRPFDVMVKGRFTEQQVVAYVVNDTARPSTPTIDAIIQASWASQAQRAQRAGIDMFNGSILRLVKCDTRGGTFRLTVGPGDYMSFVGTNMADDDRLRSMGSEWFENPVGTSALIVTSDNHIVLGLRSKQVLFHSGFLHLFGGTLVKEDQTPSGTVDTFKSIKNELNEELRITDHEISNLLCLGMVRDTAVRQPELVFRATLTISFAALDQRFRSVPQDKEHAELVQLENNIEITREFLGSGAAIAPVAIAALELHHQELLDRAQV